MLGARWHGCRRWFGRESCSDWNPTVDQQAMDRAHRLGQTRVVRCFAGRGGNYGDAAQGRAGVGLRR
jgi:hypothetical protein